MKDHTQKLEELAAALRGGDEETRVAAARGLPEVPTAEALELCVWAMGDDSFRVRKEAARAAIAWPDGAAAATRVVAALGEPDNVGRRNAALEAVTGLGAHSLAPLLTALAEQPEHRKVLVDALGALPEAPPGRIAPALAQALLDPDPNVRATAAEGLGNLAGPPPEVVPALTRALREDPDLVVRLGALESLNRQRVPLPLASLRPLLGELVLRPAALLALGRSRDAAALPLLIEGLLDRARGTREAALRGLCDLHEDLPGSRDDIEAAVRKLSEPALRSTIRALLEASPDARAAAATLLRFTGQPEVVRPLVLALLDQHEAVARAAERALSALGDGAVEVLCDLLPSLDASGRRALLSFFARAGEALRGRLGATTRARVQALLRERLSSPEGAQAARALGAIGGLEVREPLERAAAGEGAIAAAAREALLALDAQERPGGHGDAEPGGV